MYYHKIHDDVIKWKHFPRYWPFVRGIHQSPVNSLHKGQWRWALMFFICVWINGWVNKHEAGNWRRYRAHYNVTVMSSSVAWRVTRCRFLLHRTCTNVKVTTALLVTCLPNSKANDNFKNQSHIIQISWDYRLLHNPILRAVSIQKCCPISTVFPL